MTELGPRDAQGREQLPEVLERDVLLAALDGPDVRAVDVGGQSKGLLREVARLPQAAQHRAQRAPTLGVAVHPEASPSAVDYSTVNY